MKTFTININSAPVLKGNDKEYEISDLINPTILRVMLGDGKGYVPTTITTITTISLGTIEIEPYQGEDVIFTPNGTLGTGTFDYTIEDSLGRTDTNTITITTV